MVVLIWCVGHGAISIEGHGAVRTLSHASHTRVVTEGVIIQHVDAARGVFIGIEDVVLRVIYRADRHIHGRRFNIARRRRHCVSEAVAAVVVLIWCVGHGAISIEGHGAVRTLSHASHTRVVTEGVIIQHVDAARGVFIGIEDVVLRVIYRADRHIHGRRFNIARRRRHCVSEAVAAVVVLIWCVGHGAISIEGHGAVRTLSHASHTRVVTEGVIIQHVDAARGVFIGIEDVVLRVIYRADRHIHGRRFNIARRRRHCVSEAVAAVVVLIWCVGHGAISIEGHGAVRTLSHASHTRVVTEGVIIQHVDAARGVFIGIEDVVLRVIYRADRHIHGRRFNIARRRRHCVSEAVAAVVVLIWCVGHGAISIEGHGAVRTLSHASHTRVVTEGVIIQHVDAARGVFIGIEDVVLRVIYRADRHIHGRRFNIARRRRHCVSEAVAAVVVLIWCVGHGAISIEGHGAVRTLSHASHTRVVTEGVIIQHVDAARGVFIGIEDVVLRVIYRADRHIHGRRFNIARRRRHCVSEAVAAVVVLIWCVGHGAISIEGHGAVRTLSHASHTRVVTEGVIIQHVDAARGVFIGIEDVVLRVIYRADRHIHGRRFNIARRRRHCVSEAVAAVVVLIWCVGHGAISIEGHGAVRTLSHASHTRVVTEGVIIQHVDAARGVFIGIEDVVLRVIYRADRHIHGRRFNIARRRRHCVSEAVAAVVVLIWCVGHGAISIEGHGAVRTLSHASHTRVVTEGVIIQHVDAARGVFIGIEDVVLRVIYRADRHIHGRRFNIARRRRHCVSEAVAAVVVLIWCVGHGAISIEGHGAVRTLSHASHTRVVTEGVIIQHVDAARGVFIGIEDVVLRVIYRADRHIHGRRFNIARRRRHCVSEAVAAVVVLIWCVGHGAISIEGHGAVRTLSHASHTRVVTEGVIIQHVDAARGVFIGIEDVVLRVIYRADRHIHGRRFNIARRRRHCVSEAVAAVVVLIWCVGHGAISIEGHGAVRTLSHASHTRVVTEGVIIQHVDAARGVFIGIEDVVLRVIYRADRHIHGRRFNIARRRRHCVSEAVAAVVVLIWCVGHGAISIEGHGAVRTLSHASHTRVVTEGVIIQHVDAARGVFIGIEDVVLRVIYRADRHIHGRRFNIARRRRHCVSEAVAAVVVLIWCVGHGAISIEGHGAVRTLSHASHTRVVTEGVIIQHVDAARGVFIGIEDVVLRVIYRADRHIHGRRFNIARRRRHCVSEAVAAVVVLIWCVGHGAISIEGHGAVRTLSHASHTRVVTEGVIIQHVDAARGVFIGIEDVVLRVIYRADRHIHGRRFNIARRRRHCVSEAVAAVVVLIWCVGHGAISIEGHGAVRTLSHASHTRVVTEGVIIQHVDAARGVFIGIEDVVLRVIYRADRHIHGRRFNIARRRRHCVSEAVAAVVVLIWCVGHGAISIEGHGAVRTLSHASHTRVVTEGVIIQHVDAARGVFIGIEDVVLRVIYRADRHIHGRRFNIARRRRHCVSEAVAAVVVLIWCVGHGAISIEGHGAVRTLSHASHTRVVTEGVIIQHVDAARGVFIGIEDVVLRVIYRADRHIHGRRFNIARRRRHCVSEAVAAVVVLIWCVGHGAISIEGHGAVRTLSHASHTRVVTEGVIIQHVDAARGVFIGIEDVVLRVIYRADRHIHGRRFNIARRRRHCVSEAVAAVVVLIWCVGHGAISIEGHGAVRTLSHASHTRVVTEGVIIQHVDAARGVFIGIEDVVLRVIYRADRHIHGRRFNIARRRRHCVSEAVAAVVVLIWCVGHGAISIEGHGAVRTLSHASHTRVVTEGVIIQHVDAARGVFIGIEDVVLRVIYRADRHIHGRRFNIARRRRHCVSEAVAAVVVLIWCVGHGAISIEGHGAVRTLSHASHTRVVTEGVIIQHVDAARGVFIGIEDVVLRVIYRADRHIHGRRFNIARRRRHCVSEAVAAVVVLIWCVGHGAISIEGHGAVRTLSHASHTRVVTEGVIIQHVDAARGVFIGIEDVVLRVIYRADRHIHGRRFNIARRRRHCVSEAVAAVVVLIWCVGHGAISIEGHGAVRTLSHASHTRVVTEGVIIQHVDAARGVFIGIEDVVLRVIYRADRHIHGRRFNIARRRRHCVSEAVAAVVVLIWCVGHGAISIEGHGAVRTLSHASHTRVVTEGVIIQHVDAARGVFIGIEDVVLRVIYRADRHIHGRRFNIARRRRHCVSEAVAAVVVLIWCVGHGAISIEGHGAVRTLSHASHTRVVTEGVIIQHVDAARGVFIGIEDVVLRVIYRADRHIHGRRFNIARRRRHCVSEAVAAVVVLIWCVGHGAISIEGHGAVRTLSHASHTRVVTEGVIIQHVDAARGVFIGIEDVVLRVIYRADRHIHGRRFNIARRRRHCVSEAVAAVVVLIWCVGHGAISIEGHGAVRTLSHASHTRVVTEGVIIQHVDAARGVFIGIEDVVLRVIYRADRHIHGRRFNIARRRRHCVSEAVAAVVVLIWCVGHGAISIEGHGAVRTLSHASHTRVVTEGVIIQHVDAARGVFIGIEDVVLRVIYRADRHIHGRRFNIARRRRHCVSEAVAAVVVLIWCVGHGAISIEGHGAVRTLSHASHTRVVTEGVIIQHVDAARGVFIGIEDVVLRVIYRADRHIHGRRFNIARRRRHCVSEAVAAVVVLIWCVGHGAISIEGHGAVRTLSHASHTRVVTEGVIIQHVDAARGVFIGIEDVVLRVIYRADRHIHGRRFNIARRRRHCVSEAVAAVVVLIWCVGHGAISIEGHGAVRTLSHASHTRVVTEGVIIQHVDAARGVFIGIEDVVLRVIYRADRHIHGRRFNIARRRRHCVSEAVAAVVVLIWCVGHGAISIEGHGAVRTLSHASHTRVVTEGVIIQHVDAARGVFIGIEDVVLRVIYRADRHIHGRRFNIARRRRHCVSEAVAAVVVLIWCVGHGAISIEGHGAVRTLSHASHTRVVTEGVIIQHVDAARGVFIGIEDVVLRVIYRADRHIHGRRFNIARRRRHCVSEAVAAVVVLIWCVGHGAISIEGHGAVRTLSHASHTRVVTEGVIIQHVDAARGVFIGIEDVVLRVIYRADRHIHGRRFNIARRRRHCVSEAVAAVVVLIWCVGHGAISIEGHGAVRTLSHASHTRVVTEGVIIQHVDAARGVFIGIEDVVLRVIYRADRHIHGRRFNIARRRRHCVSEAVAAVVVLIWCVGHGAISIEGHGAVRTLSHASHTRVVTEGVIIQHVDAARGVFIGIEDVVLRVIYRADRHIHGRRFNIARRRRHCVSEAVAAVVVLIWCVGHGAISIEGHGAVRTLSHASHTRVVTEGVIIQHVDAARGVFIGIEDVVLRVIYRADRHIHGRRFNIARRRRHCVSEAVAAVVVLIWCVGHGAISIEGHGAVRTLSHASHTRVVTEGVIIQHVDAARGVFIGIEDVVLRVIYRADRHIHGRRFNIARRRRHCVSEAVAAVVVLIWCVGHGAISIEGHGAVRTLSHASHTRVVTEGVIIQHVDAARGVFIGIEDVVLRVIYRADRHIHGRRFNIARRRRHCVSEAVAAVVVLIWCVGHGAISIEGHGAVRTLSHASHTRVVTEGVIIQHVDAARGVFIGIEDVVLRVIYRADRHIHGRRFNIARRRRHCVSEAVAAVVVLIWCVGHGAISIEGHGAVRTLSHASHTRVVTEGVIIQHVDAARGVFIGIEDVVLRVIYRADRHIHGRRFNIARRRRHCVSEAVAAVVVLIWCVGHGAISIEGHGAVRTLSHASHTRVVTEGVIIQHVDAARGVFIGIEDVVLRVIYRADRHIHGRRFNIARRRRHCVSEAVAAVVVLIWCVGHGAISIEGHGAVRTLSHASHTRVVTEGVIIQHVDAARGVFIGIEDVVLRVIYRADRHIHGRRFNIARRRRHCVSEAVAAVVVLIWCVGHGAISIEGHGAVRTLSHASHTRVVTEGVIIQHVDAARGVFIGIEDVVLRVIYRADRHN